MKIKLITVLFWLSLSSFITVNQDFNTKFKSSASVGEISFYDFKINDINGKTFDFSTLKGKKVLVVNTAYDSSLTSAQLSELEQLYKKYKDQNFTIVAFPTNDFKSNCTVHNHEFKDCYHNNYNVTFPVMEKISVKGKNKHDLYKYLTEKAKNGKQSCGVLWDFQKYLINERGIVEKVIDPKVSPTDTKIVDWIVEKS